MVLRGRTLVETYGDRTSETVLIDDAALLAVLPNRFGIDLDRVPAVTRAPFDRRLRTAP